MRRFASVKGSKVVAVSDTRLLGELCVSVPLELDEFSPDELVTSFRFTDGRFVSRLAKKPANEQKVAFVGNWRMQCGISSYSENLLPHLFGMVKEMRLFVERNPSPTGQMNVVGGVALPESHVVECWSRGEATTELVERIEEFDPDVVLIQHEFGIWPNARHWLSLMSQLSHRRVIVTMHSVFHHRDKTIVEAAIPEIVVHLEGARAVLKDEKRVSGKVTVIPHGCYPCVNRQPLWNLYRTPFTLVQFGFGFQYKGWEESIRATGILKDRFPDVFFTGVFSESPFCVAEHQAYHDRLMALVKKLKLQNNVAIIRGFQSDEALDSFLRTNSVAVFPYVSHPKHEVFGASGAARLAMSKAIPVVTSNVNHFLDLPTLKADTPEAIAEHLDKLFSDPQARKEQVERQLLFIDENSWERVAMRYADLFGRK